MLRLRAAGAAALVMASAMVLAGCAGPAAGAAAGPAPGWSWELPECAGYQPEAFPALRHRVAAVREHRLGRRVQVEHYRPGWGRRAVADIERLLRECGSYEYGGSGDPAAFREQHRVVDRGFAGAESLLVASVRLRPPAVRGWCATVVRTGDRVATVRAPHPQPWEDECRPETGAAVAALWGATGAGRPA